MIVLFTAIFTMMSVIEDRNEGFLLSVLVAPVPRAAIVLGKVLGGTTLAAVQGMIFLVFAPLVGVHFTVGSFGLIALTDFPGVVRPDRAGLRHRMAHGFDASLSRHHQFIFDSAVAAFGSAFSDLESLRVDSLAHVCQPADLRSGGSAHPDVSGGAEFILIRILADRVAFDAGAVHVVHVRTCLRAGESPHDQASSLSICNWSIGVICKIEFAAGLQMTNYHRLTTVYMPFDILALAAHRDDVEQTCGGTLLKMAERGYRTGILDLTQGEMGTRGTAEDRAREASDAARILKVSLAPGTRYSRWPRRKHLGESSEGSARSARAASTRSDSSLTGKAVIPITTRRRCWGTKQRSCRD